MIESSWLSPLIKKHKTSLCFILPVCAVLVVVWCFQLSYFTGASNLALGKYATQSSIFGPANAARAVDSVTDGDYNAGSVAHTLLNKNAWWEVDLGASAQIAAVVVWNRTDCCMDRLKNYWVFLSDTPFAPTDTPDALKGKPGVWSHFESDFPNPSTKIGAGGAHGRYVRVQLAGEDWLSLAEVQVIGAPAAK